MSARATAGNGLVSFEIDEAALSAIEKALGSLRSESRKVLKNAVNATAKQARSDLAKKAQEEYTAKKSALNSSMKRKNATTSNPTATITVTGESLELRQFKTSTPRSGAKVKITASGHQAIVQRQYGQKYKTAKGRAARQEKWGRGADMTQIKKLLSISAPKMIGDEKKVYGVLRPDIYANLAKNIQKEINKVVSAK